MDDKTGKLGTVGGVFTPSLLTILGLVLFLRLGFVTGNVGLGQMLLILALATTVSVLTTISLAAIATNLKVGGGGVYFLISRTLGPAFGGAIGLVLYLAIAVSVAFYAIGLGEAVSSVVESDNQSLPGLSLLGPSWPFSALPCSAPTLRPGFSTVCSAVWSSPSAPTSSVRSGILNSDA